MFPPNKSNIESDTPVESLRNTVFTLIFSLNTNHGYGILGTLPFTEFYTMQHQNFRTLMDYSVPQNKMSSYKHTRIDENIGYWKEKLTAYRRTGPSSIVFSAIDFSLFCITFCTTSHQKELHRKIQLIYI